ncbi:MAG: hypothetical protein R3B46_14580 [Phycisphaerales bacterium]
MANMIGTGLAAAVQLVGAGGSANKGTSVTRRVTPPRRRGEAEKTRGERGLSVVC